MSGASVHNLGYLYVVMPTALGAIVLFIIALIVNNIPKGRRYQEFWF
jgi:CBS-domain-containing membrane protein